MKCVHLEDNGRCSGQYKGFTCIGEKCRAEKELPCPHFDQGFYCTKFRRFGCVGMSKCGIDHSGLLKAPERAKGKA